MADHPVVIALVMGVSGAGKTSVAEALAARTGWPFLEGDSLHPASNVAKMSSGTPLDDDDRAPWLAAIVARIALWRAAGTSGVVTCSALKRRYRDVLRDGHSDLHIVYLKGDLAVLGPRMAERKGHFMPPGLLDSQLATLEEPTADERTIVVPVGPPVETLVDEIIAALAVPPG